MTLNLFKFVRRKTGTFKKLSVLLYLLAKESNSEVTSPIVQVRLINMPQASGLPLLFSLLDFHTLIGPTSLFYPF